MFRKLSRKLSPAVFALFSFSFICHHWWVNFSSDNLPLQNLSTASSQFTIEDICACPEESKTVRHRVVADSKALCQSRTRERGNHQRVVSYSLDGDLNDESTFKNYFIYLDKVAQQVAQFYPGWVMRIYHKFSLTDEAFTLHLCPTYCKHRHVDLCNVTDLRVNSPSRMTENLETASPTVWQFLPLADPTVDVVLSRDLENTVTEREMEAVIEWLYASQSTLHTIRDHPAHKSSVIAGLWGVRMMSGKKKDLMKNLFYKIRGKAGYSKREYVNKVALEALHSSFGGLDIYRHDSYYCTQNPRSSHPFPTQRKGFEFVGTKLYKEVPPFATCPLECRPESHQDWEYC